MGATKTMRKGIFMEQFSSSDDKARLASVQERAKKMQVYDIAFFGTQNKASFECMEKALDILSEHQDSIRDRAREKAERYKNCEPTL